MNQRKLSSKRSRMRRVSWIKNMMNQLLKFKLHLTLKETHKKRRKMKKNLKKPLLLRLSLNHPALLSIRKKM